MLSPSLFLSERITKKTKIKTKTICKKKRQFLSQLKNLFWISWRALKSLSAPYWVSSMVCDVCVDVVGVGCCVRATKTQTNQKTKRNVTDCILRFGFSALKQHSNKTMFDSARNLILLLILSCWFGFIDSQTTRIFGHIAKCSRKYDHFKLDYLSFLKEKEQILPVYSHFNLYSQVFKVCERLWVLLLFWLLIPTSVSQRCFRTTKAAWKDIAFFCWNCSNTR